MSTIQIILLLVFIGFITQGSRRRKTTMGSCWGPYYSSRRDRWRGHARDFSRRARSFAGDMKGEFSEETPREKSLKKKVAALEDRIQVLERIVTDRGYQTAQDIDNL